MTTILFLTDLVIIVVVVLLVVLIVVVVVVVVIITVKILLIVIYLHSILGCIYTFLYPKDLEYLKIKSIISKRCSQYENTKQQNTVPHGVQRSASI